MYEIIARYNYLIIIVPLMPITEYFVGPSHILERLYTESRNTKTGQVFNFNTYGPPDHKANSYSKMSETVLEKKIELPRMSS